MMKTTPTIERYGDTVVVVARNAEEAQQAAMDVLGAKCTVKAVDRVRTGGVGGFFATEMVRLTATNGSSPSTAPRAAEALFTGSDSDMEAVLASAEDLVASLNRRTSGFAERLLDEITATSGAAPETQTAPATTFASTAASAPSPASHHADDDMLTAEDRERIAALAEILHANGVAAATEFALAPVATPAPAVVQPISPVTAAATAHDALRRSSVWSAPALRVIGVPDEIVQAVAAQDPHDDVEWLMALMQALRPYCEGPRPGSSLVVGPACANLARQLRFMSITAEELPEVVSSVAVPHVSAKDLSAVGDDRAIHLVVGGSWQHLATVPVSIVSAATDGDLVDALRIAAAWGATLGWIWSGDRYERIDPFFVAGRVRDALTAPAPAPTARHGNDSTTDGADGDSSDDHLPIR